MTKRTAITSKEQQLVLIGELDSYVAPRVQRNSMNADVPNTPVDELGNSKHAGTSKDKPTVTFSFSALDVGTKLFSLLTGTNPNAYPAAGVDISQLGEIDALLRVKDESVAKYTKSIYGRRLRIRDFTFNFSENGDSSEDYTAIGSSRRYFQNDVIVQKFTTGTSFTLTTAPKQLKNGNYGISVISDGKYLTEVTGAPAAGEYRIVTTTLTIGTAAAAQVLVAYHIATDSSTWTDTGDTTMPASIRGKNVPVYIAANSIPRVQSVTVNGSMNVTPVNEMGNVETVGYTQQVPDVTGTITVLDTDSELINLFENGVLVTSGVDEWQPGEGCVASGVELKIKLLDPCDTTSVLKTYRVPQLVITSDAFSTNVNGNSASTYNWRSDTAELIVYSGDY